MPIHCCSLIRSSPLLLLTALVGCAGVSALDNPDPSPPLPAAPFGQPAQPAASARRQAVIDLTRDGAVVRGTTPAEVFDSRAIANPVQEPDFLAATRRIRDILPPHPATPNANQGDDPQADVPPGSPVAGTTLDEHRTRVEQTWPAIGATGWNPPDPTLAVGPNHVLSTVNMQIAWYTRTGTQQFSIPLNDSGNPGFFETVGGGGFTFDPKCLYDHLAQRFVVIAPEYYASTQEAYICIAVSDDSDPNGVWYKYRTDCVITVGTSTYWWDYPGFGYDANAYYVTSNLFGLNVSGFGGVGFRIFHKAPLLTGSPAVYSTLRDGSAASVQVAQHFGSPIAPYFFSTNSSTSMRVRAITNPLTSPAIVGTNVTVPSYAAPTGAPTPSGTLSTVDSRIMNVCWRNGKLVAAHTINVGGRNLARWYEINTNNWPTSGSCTLAQSGNVDPGPDLHAYFPAVYHNAAGDIGMVLAVSNETTNPAVAVAARRASDPLGRMGVPEIVRTGDAPASGRWGDYFDMAIDPNDGMTFWSIGEFAMLSGWSNWISSFVVADDPVCHPVPDGMGTTVAGTPVTIDVLANDWHSSNLTMTIASFQNPSLRGGTVVRSVGTGPGGRDRLVYTPPSGYNGADSFTYTVSDPNAQSATTSVVGFVLDPATFKAPDAAMSQVRPLVDAAYFALSNPTVLPNFDALTPYAGDEVASVNFASTDGAFATSGLADNVGAVFEGFINVPTSGLYTIGLNSDDGSRLILGSTTLITNDGLHGMTDVTANIGLQAGLHRARIEFFEAGGGAGLIASIGPYGGSRVAIPSSQWFRLRCDGDVNCDFALDGFDVETQERAVGGDMTDYCQPNPDFNGDFALDGFDVEAVELVVGGGACP